MRPLRERDPEATLSLSPKLTVTTAMMAALGNFFYAMGLQYEAGRRCDEFLASDLEPAGRAEMLYWAANFEWYRDPAMTLRRERKIVFLNKQG